MKLLGQFPVRRLTCALLLSLSASPAAWAVNIAHNDGDNCYSPPDNASGHEFYLMNNTATNSLTSNGALGGGTYYGGPNFEPGTPIPPLRNDGGCVSYHSSGDPNKPNTYKSGSLNFSIGGYTFRVELGPKAGDTGNLTGGYSVSLDVTGISGWTTSGGCPGYTSVSAGNGDITQTICNHDYIVSVTTTAANGTEGNNGAALLVNDNPAGSASGTQSIGGSSVKSTSGNPPTRSLAGATAQPQAVSGQHDLASRFVNDRRWSVIHNAETGSFSGMSHSADGLQHDQFVHCTFASDDGNPDLYARQSTYSCQTAHACTDGQCGAEMWQASLPENVILPGTFFNRPDGNLAEPTRQIPPVGGDRDVRLALEALPTVTTKKIHQTPDGQFTLISVNLRGYEWLLTYDGSQMFGVIPHGAMGQPRFLHCQQTTQTANEVTLDCLEAYRCHFGPCTDEQWSPVSSVTLAKSFFDVSATSPNTDALITHYYQSILDRTPDLMGFAYWQNVVANTQAQGGYVAQVFRDMGYFFFNSPEYLSMNKADIAYVEDLYQTFFQRQPDPSGQAFWLDQLAQGVARNQVMAGFLYSVEFREYMASLGI